MPDFEVFIVVILYRTLASSNTRAERCSLKHLAILSEHCGKTHCAWVQIWASGQLRISGYVLKSNVNKIKSHAAKFENKK